MAINFEQNPKEQNTLVETNILVSDRAANRIRDLLNNETITNQVFRVSVLGGGCSGFQYDFSFDTKENSNDIVIDKLGIKVVIDKISSTYLSGSEIDFLDDVMGSMFVVKNPNATASCGCGTSFSLG